MSKSALQSLIMVSIVLIALIVFTFAACNALRGNANKQKDTTDQTTDVGDTTDEQTTKRPKFTLPNHNEVTTPKVVTTKPKPQTTLPKEETTTEPETTTAPIPDFRNSFWGDSVEAVKEVETDVLVKESKTVLLYRTKVIDYSANLVFYFDDNGKLYNGTYLFTDKHAKGLYYLNQYNELKNSLNVKYGKFLTEEVKYHRDKELVDAIGEATALEFGYISYLATWKTENTQITLSMMADNYEIFIIASYTDLNKVEKPKDPSGL